jgi:hypothetical protein
MERPIGFYMESKFVKYFFISLFILSAIVKSDGISYKAFEGTSHFHLYKYSISSFFSMRTIINSTLKSDIFGEELRMAIKCNVDGGWREKKVLGMTLDQDEIYKIGLPTNLIHGGYEVEKHDCLVEIRVMSNTSSKIIIQFKKSNKGTLTVSSKELMLHNLKNEQKIMSRMLIKYKGSTASNASPTSPYH